MEGREKLAPYGGQPGNLAHRGMSVDSRCSRCNSAKENVFHTIWGCRVSAVVWKLTGWWKLIKSSFSWDLIAFSHPGESRFVALGLRSFFLPLLGVVGMIGMTSCTLDGGAPRRTPSTVPPTTSTSSDRLPSPDPRQESGRGSRTLDSSSRGGYMVCIDAALSRDDEMYGTGGVLCSPEGLAGLVYLSDQLPFHPDVGRADMGDRRPTRTYVSSPTVPQLSSS